MNCSRKSRLRSCVDPILLYAKRPTPFCKGTISIRKANSLDYTYLDYRLRADQRAAPMDNTACELTALHLSELR
jgi:hypothetical protein